MKGSLDAAVHHVVPVLDLPAELRISTVTGYMRKLGDLLAQPRFAGSQAASSLRHQISDFISSAAGTDTARNV
jgi:hypothetical protein